MEAKGIGNTDVAARIEYPDGVVTIVQDPDDPARRIFTFIGEIDGAPLTQIDRLPAVHNDPLHTECSKIKIFPENFMIPNPRTGKGHSWTKVSNTLYKCKCGFLEWRPVGVIYELRADSHELFVCRKDRLYGPLIKSGLNDIECMRKWNRAAAVAKDTLKTRNQEERDEHFWQMAELEIIAGCFNKICGEHWSSRYDDAVGEAFKDLKRYRNSVVASQKRPKPRTSIGLHQLVQALHIQPMFPPKLALTGEELFQRLQEYRSKQWDLCRVRMGKGKA